MITLTDVICGWFHTVNMACVGSGWEHYKEKSIEAFCLHKNRIRTILHSLAAMISND